MYSFDFNVYRPDLWRLENSTVRPDFLRPRALAVREILAQFPLIYMMFF